MLASPSRRAAVPPVLILIALIAAIVVGYAWYRGHGADQARSTIGARALPGEQAIPYPQRHWSYGPIEHGGQPPAGAAARP
jgi:hypothetical protein